MPGLTSSPYMAIQNTGIGMFGGSNTTSLVLVPTSITLFYANGDLTQPYLSIQSAGISIVNGSYSLTVTASLVKAAYSTTIYTSVTSTGVNIVSGSYSTLVTATGVTLSAGSSAPAVTLSSTELDLYLAYTYGVGGSTSAPFIRMNASTGIQIQNGSYQVIVQSSQVQIANNFTGAQCLLESDGLRASAGNYTLKALATGITLTESTSGNSLDLTDSSVVLQAGSGPSITITDTPSALIFIQGSSTSKITLDGSGTATFTGTGGTTTSINGNVVTCGTLNAVQILGLEGIQFYLPAGMASSATGGSITPPSQVAAYLQFTVNGGQYKVPVYNN